MEEWKTYKLGDLVNLYSGGTPNKSKAGYWGGSIPWISAKSMYEDFLSTSDLFITESGLKAGSKLAKKDTILLLTRGSGLFNRIPVCWTERDLAFNQDVKNIVSKDDSVLLNQYLYYWLYGNKAGITAILETTGIGAGKIDTERFLSLDVSIPSVDEQNRIIRIVEPIFDKIALNNRINHNLEKQIQERFDRMIVSDNGLGYCQIADYVDVNPKRSIGKKVLTKCIDMSYLSTTGPFPSGWETKGYNGGMKFMNGDTIMARITPCLENGKVAFVNFLDDGEVAFGSTEYIVLHSKEGVAPEFTYFLARNRGFVDYATKNMNGSSGRQRVSGDTIEKYMIPVIDSPSLDEFSSFAAPAMEVIRNNCFESRSLASTRDALLPLLLSENPQLRK